MNEDFNSVMNKLYALCSATNATLLYEAKIPPANAIRKGEEPFMRYTICDKLGTVLVHEETRDDNLAACRLILNAYEDYILDNGIEMHIRDLGGLI